MLGTASPEALRLAFAVLNTGDWRCWLPFSLEGYASWQPHYELAHLAFISQVGVSRYCCQEGSPCWDESFTAERCCGEPVLPCRCDAGICYAPSRNSDGSFSLAAEASPDPSRCATLDEAGAYFGDPVHGASDKFSVVHDYLSLYSSVVPIPVDARILEVGVEFGNSLAMWGFWAPRGEVVGVDVKPLDQGHWDGLVARGANASGNLRTVLGDSAGAEVVAAVGDRAWDLVIDDGDHCHGHQIDTFENLFPLVRPGGYYVVEDVFLAQSGALSYANCPPAAVETLAYFQALAQQAWVEPARHYDFSRDADAARWQGCLLECPTPGPGCHQCHRAPEVWRKLVDWVLFRRDHVVIRKWGP